MSRECVLEPVHLTAVDPVDARPLAPGRYRRTRPFVLLGLTLPAESFEAMLGDGSGRPAKTGDAGPDRGKLLDLTSQMRMLIRMLSDILTRDMDHPDANESRRSEGWR